MSSPITTASSGLANKCGVLKSPKQVRRQHNQGSPQVSKTPCSFLFNNGVAVIEVSNFDRVQRTYRAWQYTAIYGFMAIHFDEFHEKQASELRSQWKLPIEQQKALLGFSLTAEFGLTHKYCEPIERGHVSIPTVLIHGL
ncbi:hypothetical protein SUGI_0708150 [Cryptomeria japonica]|nr:hypothetical protein SUGI_0708150 [Cryptomeria japonica]